MKEKLYKLVLALMVSLSLGSSPIAQNEILKMLESFSVGGTVNTQIQELNEEENESEEIKRERN